MSTAKTVPHSKHAELLDQYQAYKTAAEAEKTNQDQLLKYKNHSTQMLIKMEKKY